MCKNNRMSENSPAGPVYPRYTAPALEKGLDILELLGAEPGRLSAAEIAQRLGRSIGELFRMLAALERRGYLERDGDGTYALTLKLYELAHRQPPLERLVGAALPLMRALASQVGQSCHLATHDAGRVMVVAQAESGRPRGFVVRVGAAYELLGTASGRVLLAFQPDATRSDWLARTAVEQAHRPSDLDQKLAAIRERGFEITPSDAVHGIIDLSHPVLTDAGRALAAVTTPFVEMRGNPRDLEETRALQQDAARCIAQRLGLSTPAPVAGAL
jgi:DNA-binding IclR family transcriptional regulator